MTWYLLNWELGSEFELRALVYSKLTNTQIIHVVATTHIGNSYNLNHMCCTFQKKWRTAPRKNCWPTVDCRLPVTMKNFSYIRRVFSLHWHPPGGGNQNRSSPLQRESNLPTPTQFLGDLMRLILRECIVRVEWRQHFFFSVSVNCWYTVGRQTFRGAPLHFYLLSTGEIIKKNRVMGKLAL